MGRVVFTTHVLPAIQPVNHVIDDGDIIIRTHLGTAITMAVDRHDAVVAYEAGVIDALTWDRDNTPPGNSVERSPPRRRGFRARESRPPDERPRQRASQSMIMR
jgi:hypothetical protein